MPFENFYNESEKRTRRWQMAFGLIIFPALGYWLLPFLGATLSSFTIPEEKSFSAPEREARLDELCANLPMPEKLTLLRKESPVHLPNGSFVYYIYGSEEDRNGYSPHCIRCRSPRPPEEVMPFFVIWFNSNGWKSIAENGTMFRKDNLTVSINLYAPFDVLEGYQIVCSETS
jgi:hypothetical protein